MGLGSKIKEALGSDKGHRSSPSQSRRTAPGAYPDSVADIPRTASTNTKARTWDATDTYAKEKQQQQTAAATTNTTTTADNPRTSDNASDEYTFSPVSDKDNLAKTNDESELIAPSPDSRIAGNPTTNNAAFAKDAKSQQHPYWGNIGKADARDDARGMNGRAPVSPFDDHHSQAAYIDDAGVPVSGNSLGRNGTINNGDYSRMGHHADARGYDDDERYGSPILASVNHGQPRLAADDDEARVASMAATQLSHGSEYNGSQAQGPVGLGYPSAIPDRTNSRHDRAGYGARYDDRDDYGTRQGMTGSPGPMPSNARGTFGSPQGINDVHGAGNGYAVGGRAVDQFAGKDRGQSGSTGSSANGNNSAGASKAGSSGDHYGPGHSGARVLHRCEHCGNDNDISKYFSKDVVYRLS